MCRQKRENTGWVTRKDEKRIRDYFNNSAHTNNRGIVTRIASDRQWEMGAGYEEI